MTGEELVDLMRDRELSRAISKIARRHSRKVEDQEEYIQDAWFRIAKQPSGRDLDFYEQEALRSINASRMRKVRVHEKLSKNVHGNSERGEEKPPKDSMPLGRGRYLLLKHEKLKMESGKPVNPPYHKIVVVRSESERRQDR